MGLLLFGGLLLSSCISPIFDSSSETISSVSESLSSTEEPSSSPSSQSTAYEKDDDGFLILEENYFSYVEDETSTLERNVIEIPQDVAQKEHYDGMRLYCGDRQIPVYAVKTNYMHSWDPAAPYRMDNAVASFGFSGVITLTLQTTFALFDDTEISPINQNVPYSVDKERRVVTFTLSVPGPYTISFRQDKVLHLFANPLEDKTYNESNSMYFGPGVHTKDNDSRINGNNEVYLSSNTTVYFHPAAFVKARFVANYATNIKMCGSGYIDGSSFPRNASTGEVTVPLDFNYCKQISFSSFGVLDPAGWCFNLYFCEGVTLQGCKVISSRSNGDGISVQSCQNVFVDSCFVRSWDDSLVVKNYPRWSDRTQEGTTRNVHFSSCVLWTDLAQSMEIGYETVGKIMEDITFKDITVIHNYHKPVFSIHNSNNANVKGVRYENITVEHADMGRGDGVNTLLEFSNEYSATWSNVQKTTSLGSMTDVAMQNILVMEGSNAPRVSIRGAIDPRNEYSKDVHWVTDIRIQDFSLYGRPLLEGYENLDTAYASGVVFTSSGNKVSGAGYPINEAAGSFGPNIDFITM